MRVQRSCLNAPACGGSAVRGARFCEPCRRALSVSFEPRSVDAEGLHGLPLYRSAEDSGPWGQLLRRAKRQPWGLWDPGLEAFYRDVCRHWACELAELRPDALVWVPPSPWRAWRETDLAAQCALWLARELRVPAPRLLRRRWLRVPRAQKNLGRRDRWQLASRKGDWLWDAEAERRWTREGGGRRVLIVDDLCATGASLIKTRTFLEARGYAAVGAWVLARRSHAPA